MSEAQTAKLDAYLGFKVNSEDLREWKKFLPTREDNLARSVRRILNREVELKKKEQKS